MHGRSIRRQFRVSRGGQKIVARGGTRSSVKGGRCIAYMVGCAGGGSRRRTGKKIRKGQTFWGVGMAGIIDRKGRFFSRAGRKVSERVHGFWHGKETCRVTEGYSVWYGDVWSRNVWSRMVAYGHGKNNHAFPASLASAIVSIYLELPSYPARVSISIFAFYFYLPTQPWSRAAHLGLSIFLIFSNCPAAEKMEVV
jgi:hypothetical protein